MELEKDPKYPKKSQEEWKMLNTLKLLTSNHIAKLSKEYCTGIKTNT